MVFCISFSLITDMWSPKIVGFHVGESLETEGALLALAMALSFLKYGEKPVSQIARDLGINESVLYHWVHQAGQTEKGMQLFPRPEAS